MSRDVTAPRPVGGRADRARRPLAAEHRSGSGVGAFVAGLGLVLAALVVYVGRGSGGSTRSLAERSAEVIVAVQRALALDVERDVQGSLLGRGLLGDVFVAVYGLGYWTSVVAALAVCALRSRDSLIRLLWAIALSGLAGLLVFTTFPVAPPRLVGALDDQLAASSFGVIAHPSGWFNPYAAMPSFHVCWTVLAALGARRVVGSAALVVPATMSVAVVTTGNHWVLDVVAGWALAALAWRAAPSVHAVALAGVRRRDAERAPPGADAGRGPLVR